MNCADIRDSLYLYAAGEAGAEEAKAVEEHARGCASCSRELAVYGKLPGALSRSSQLPEARWDAYTQKILDRLEKRRAPSGVFQWRWAAPSQGSGTLNRILHRASDTLGRSVTGHPLRQWRWAAVMGVAAIAAVGILSRKDQPPVPAPQIQEQEVVANLDVLENLDVLARDDFEKEAVQ